MPLSGQDLAGDDTDPIAGLAQRVLRDAPFVVITLELDGQIKYVNPFFERLTGHRLDDVRGKSWFDTAIPERDRERIRARFSQSVGGRHVRNHVNAIVTRSGEERQIEWTDEFLRDDDGQASSLLAIGQDVTERVASEIQHRSVIAAMHDGVVVQGPNGEIIDSNAAAQRMLGLSADQMAGRTSIDPRWHCVHGDGTPFPGETHPAMVTLRSGATTSDVVMGVYREAGDLVWLSVNSEPLRRPDDGAVIGAVTSFTDITARKLAEDELRNTEHRLAMVLENISDGFFTLDRQWRYGNINAVGARMVGRTPQELIGQRYLDAFPEAAGMIWERTYRQVMETGMGATVEEYHEPLDMWFEAVVHPFGDGISVFFRDISTRKRAERAVQNERDHLRQIFDSQFGFMAKLTRDGVIIEVNQMPLDLMRVRREDVIGRPFWEIGWLERGTQPLIQVAIATAARGEIWRGDVLAEFPDAGRRTLDVVFSPLRDARGKVTSVLEFGIDITDRNRIQTELTETTSLLGTVLTNAPITIFATDADGVFTLSDGKGLKRVGMQPGDNVGHSAVELFGSLPFTVASGTVTTGADVIRDALRGESITAVSQLGDVVFENRIGPIRNAAGAVIGVVGVATDISEITAAETVARRSDALLTTVLEGAPVMLFALDAQGVVRFSEGRQLERIDVRPGELVGTTIFERYGDALEFELAFRQALAGAQVSFSTRLGAVSLEVALAPSRDKRGAIDGVIGVALDVSEREHSHELLRQAQSIAKLGSWELDLSTNALRWSDEIFRIFEIDPARFGASYDAFLAAIHPDDRDTVDFTYRASVVDHTPYEIVHRLLMPDGRVKWVHERGRTEYDAALHPVRSIGTVQDISARVQSEALLRERERLLDLIFNHASDAMLLLSMDAGATPLIVAANRSFLGRIRSERPDLDLPDVIERTFEQVAWDAYGRSSESLTEFHAAIRGVVDTGESFTFEYQLTSSDGPRFLHASLVPVLNIAGLCTHVLWTSRDVTAERLTTTRIRNSLAEKETLLREIHHRVKNNLQVVAGLLHFQAKKVGAPEDAEAFREIRERIMAMGLVHEHLYRSADLARIDLASYVRSLVEELTRSLAPHGGMRIEVAADEVALPIEIAMPCGMIVNELVTNALKHAFPLSHAGTTALRIQRTVDHQVVLTVDDDGVGFPTDFSPADGGSFGWELVRTLVMQIGGTVTATTDRGARVRVTFPAPVPRQERSS